MTSEYRNAVGHSIGFPLPNWTARPRPPRTPMEGRYARLEPLSASRHADALHEAYAVDRAGAMWTYLVVGPFADSAAYRAWVEKVESSEDPFFQAIIDKATGRALGVASFMRIEPAHGVIEVGNIAYSPALQRSRLATEAMYVMMKRAFDELGYRRYEWKCDSLNAPSRKAALRLGFQYEGLFRQAVVYRQRNRDTTWFSIIDREWPALKRAYERWLDPANFDAAGAQRGRLEAFIAEERARSPQAG
jgi:RimJ/RimL family protein N-acetyltransferase